jgi:hypothetical protein
MLNYLKKKNFHFTNDRGLIDTCRDAKSFLGLLGDLLAK